jgi:protein arginine N-methyltransferase 2
VILGEGIRSEMLKAVMSASAQQHSEEDTEEEDPTLTLTNPAQTQHTASKDGEDRTSNTKSTASDNQTFLSSRLVFKTDPLTQQEICVDREGNGVMMGWETNIMERTAEKLCAPYRYRVDRENGAGNQAADDDENLPLRIMNVGFGLGIVS